MRASAITAHGAGAGLFAGAAAWALHQQIEFVIASILCRNSATTPMWVVSAVAVVALVIGGILSWLAIRSLADDSEAGTKGAYRARQFFAKVAIMGAFLFFFAIALQAGAILYLPVCTG